MPLGQTRLNYSPWKTITVNISNTETFIIPTPFFISPLPTLKDLISKHKPTAKSQVFVCFTPQKESWQQTKGSYLAHPVHAIGQVTGVPVDAGSAVVHADMLAHPLQLELALQRRKRVVNTRRSLYGRWPACPASPDNPASVPTTACPKSCHAPVNRPPQNTEARASCLQSTPPFLGDLNRPLECF